jgi:hypothetical protein
MQNKPKPIPDTADEVALVLLDVQTTTYAGVAALLAYAAEFVESGNSWPDGITLPGDHEKSMGRDFSFYLHRNLAEDLAEIGAAA